MPRRMSLRRVLPTPGEPTMTEVSNFNKRYPFFKASSRMLWLSVEGGEGEREREKKLILTNIPSEDDHYPILGYRVST